MPNVFYSTSFKNYPSFSLQVPSILSILLGLRPKSSRLNNFVRILFQVFCNIYFVFKLKLELGVSHRAHDLGFLKEKKTFLTFTVLKAILYVSEFLQLNPYRSYVYILWALLKWQKKYCRSNCWGCLRLPWKHLELVFRIPQQDPNHFCQLQRVF